MSMKMNIINLTFITNDTRSGESTFPGQKLNTRGWKVGKEMENRDTSSPEIISEFPLKLFNLSNLFNLQSSFAFGIQIKTHLKIDA